MIMSVLRRNEALRLTQLVPTAVLVEVVLVFALAAVGFRRVVLAWMGRKARLIIVVSVR